MAFLCICVRVWQSEVKVKCLLPQSFSILFFERQRLTLNLKLTVQLGWMVCKDLHVLSMGLQVYPTFVPTFYVGARDLNLDPHASTESPLQTEPSPWFLMVLICISMTISDCEHVFIYISCLCMFQKMYSQITVLIFKFYFW